jgi:hypothetical protein
MMPHLARDRQRERERERERKYILIERRWWTFETCIRCIAKGMSVRWILLKAETRSRRERRKKHAADGREGVRWEGEDNSGLVERSRTT